MAKKDKKKSKKKDNPGADAVGAVRTAVERTFHATADQAQSTRTRAQDLVDEVAGAAGRLREMVEQLSVLEDIKKQVEALSSRVAALERGGGSAKPAATTSRKPAARKTAARKTAARKTAARKTAARKTAAKSSGTRKAASSRKPAAKSSGTSKAASSRKPAAKQS
jgi:RNA polymerase primary sigma factor